MVNIFVSYMKRFYLDWPWHLNAVELSPCLKFLSGLEFDRAMIKVIKAGLATVIMITVGDYCSVTPGVLQMATHGG